MISTSPSCAEKQALNPLQPTLTLRGPRAPGGLTRGVRAHSGALAPSRGSTTSCVSVAPHGSSWLSGVQWDLGHLRAGWARLAQVGPSCFSVGQFPVCSTGCRCRRVTRNAFPCRRIPARAGPGEGAAAEGSGPDHRHPGLACTRAPGSSQSQTCGLLFLSPGGPVPQHLPTSPHLLAKRANSNSPRA